VWLPIATGPDGRTAAPAPRTAQTSRAALSVLVVDDNVDAAGLLADLLEHQGHTIRVAHDASEALALASTFVPDVALLDIGLPTMDGYELARRLRSLPAWRGARLIAVTGYGQASDRDRSKEAGFDHHLVKPIDLARLSALLACETAIA
jgi:CheY-like chemotaxis protein